MYTDCPSCHRQFRIRAAHLGAAGGQVQCGFCGQRYNALQRLHDQPLTPQDTAAGSPPEPTVPGAEDGFDIPADIPSPDANAAAGRPGSEPAPPSGKPPPQAATAPPPPGDEKPWAIPPELLQQDDATGAGKPRRLLWSLALLLLLLVGALQAVWFHRDRLLTDYPGLLPWAREVCDYLQCESIRNVDLDAIQVVNRDVRDHPRYDSALLVNATIVNRSGGVQPFPVVRLSLFDTAGKLIAYRRFRPMDYLDASVDRGQGMLPDNPVHIVLEVVGPTQGAVSFEFDFLPG